MTTFEWIAASGGQFRGVLPLRHLMMDKDVAILDMAIGEIEAGEVGDEVPG